MWSVVLSRFGDGRPAFEQARPWYHRLAGTEFWRRPFQMRFKSAAAVRWFERTFDGAVQTWREKTRSRHPLHATVGPGNTHDMKLFPELSSSSTRISSRTVAAASLNYLCPMRHDGNPTIVRIRRAPKHVRDALRCSPKKGRRPIQTVGATSAPRDVALPARADEPCAPWNHRLMAAPSAQSGRATQTATTPSKHLC